MTNPNNEWEELFDKELMVSVSKVKSFIRETLAAHDAELVRRIQGMRRDESCGSVNNKEYNQALTDVLSIIRKDGGGH